MNTLPHSEQALNSLFRSTTNQSAFLQAKKEIAQVISSYSQLDVAIPKRTNGKNKDIIINDTISIKDFCKKLFWTAVFFYSDCKFWYVLNFWHKEISYAPKETYWFYLSLFHEMMHAVYHRHQTSILEKHSYSSLGYLQRERHTREKTLEIIKTFEQEYGISLLWEFKSKKEVYQFIDTFLSTYVPYTLAETTKDIFFTFKGKAPSKAKKTSYHQLSASHNE